MWEKQTMRKASKEHHFSLLPYREPPGTAPTVWTAEVRELSSRHFIYFASSNLHVTCTSHKSSGSPGPKNKGPYPTSLDGKAAVRILNPSPFDAKDLALHSRGLLMWAELMGLRSFPPEALFKIRVGFGLKTTAVPA